MHRVLRPGGRAAVGIGGSGRRAWPHSTSNIHLANLASAPGNAIYQAIGEHTIWSPPQAPPSWLGDDPESALAAAFTHAGFREVETWYDQHITAYSSAEEYWQLVTTTLTPIRKFLCVQSSEIIEKIEVSFLSRVDEVLDRHGSFGCPIGSLYATGLAY